MNDITFFAKTTFRNERQKFGIRTDDRRKHMYLVGKTGMGKTEMLKNLAIQDIQNGQGLAFVDPHGEAAESLLDYIPSERINDVIYFNPADINFPLAFNVMEKVDVGHRHLVASGLMGVFKKIWPDVWSARMEYILNNAILALLEYPDSTLLGVNRMLADVDYRKEVVDKVTDPVIKSFWVNEFSRYAQRYEVEATAAIQNKIGQFISNPLIRNIVGQIETSIDMREIMDGRKILIANLSKGRIGEDNSMLLGALLITKLQLAAMSRVDMPEQERKDFYLYVDEFQNFATESFINILSEARKYRFSLILSHQYIEQMLEPVREAVFGNMGTIVAFRVGAEDAEYLEKEFYPEFEAGDLINLAKYNIYLKLMIDGVAGRPFSAETILSPPKPDKSYREEIISKSQEKYNTPGKIVEEKISAWISSFQPKEPQKTVQLYDAQCNLCGSKIKVPFLPDVNRPVYCKPCLKKIKAQEVVEEKPSFSLEDLVKKEPASFKEKKPEKKEVELKELKKSLKEALDEKEDESKEQKNNEKRTIKPGETIKF